MFKVIITWAKAESEEVMFNTKEEAEEFIKDVVSPGSNIRWQIIEE